MALMNCTECGKEFSDKAETCPNCGCPSYYPFKNIRGKQLYNRYVELLNENNNKTYTWYYCLDCSASVRIDIDYENKQLDNGRWVPLSTLEEKIERINSRNNTKTCRRCFNHNLLKIENMPFPFVWTGWGVDGFSLSDYDYFYQTYSFFLYDKDAQIPKENEAAGRALPIKHPQYIIEDYEKAIPEKNKELAHARYVNTVAKVQAQQSTPKPTPKKNEVHCPKCGSTQIQMVQRKWSLLTGFMTNKVDRVCVNCKHKF